MYYFCTYFDSNYLSRGLCLLNSLEQHCSPFKLFVLCLDDITLQKIKALDKDNMVAIGLPDLEQAVPDLLPLKAERSKIEYYYTCGPAFIRHTFELDKNIDVMTYLDSDLYFFSNPSPLFNEFQKYSIGLTGHNLSPFLKKLCWQGKYNVGWISFRRDEDGLSCLEWWRDRCIEWCYERYKDGKYADQLYLEQWPKLYKSFVEFTYRGANVAPWNVGRYRFSQRNGRIYVDNDPLIFYHFAGLKKVSKNIYNTNLALSLKPVPSVLRHLYLEYIKRLEYHSHNHNTTASIRSYRSKHHLLKNLIRFSLGIAFRQYIIVKREYSDVK